MDEISTDKMEQFESEIIRLINYVKAKNKTKFRKKLEKLLETVEQEAFLKGYEYAIEILKESIRKS